MRIEKRFSRGQGLLEFAITIPLLLLMLVGIFDLGRATFYYSSLTNSAREAARYGIINPNDPNGIIQKAREFAFGINPSELGVTVTQDTDAKTIAVLVTYNFIPATPLISAFLGGGGGIPFQTQTTMQIEG